MYIVLLSGGSGKRLWPLSNALRSKQYIKLLKKENSEEECSMVQRVWSQLEDVGLTNNSIICASKGQTEIITSQLGNVNIAVEPDRRDTFPAVALSCAYLTSKMGADTDDIVCILPVDPFTEDKYFQTLSRLPEVLEKSAADIALMGVKPTHPSEKFGYIVPKQCNDEYFTVDRFREKPAADEAQKLIENGAVWNCGVFCLKISSVLEHIEKYGFNGDYDEMFEKYDSFPKISFDYEILEKCNSLAAVDFDGQWKDLGTWNSLVSEMSRQSVGNCLIDNSCENTHIINELDIPVVTAGTKNLTVVASFDGILVTDNDESPRVKDIVSSIDNPPMYEERRWGTIKVMDSKPMGNDEYNETRKITIFSGCNCSYHYHKNRDEVWTIIKGNAEIVVNGIRQLISTGEVIRFPRMTIHAIHALTDLEFIEIQIGKSYSNQDINRITVKWDQIEYI